MYPRFFVSFRDTKVNTLLPRSWGPPVQLGPLFITKLCRDLPGLRIMLILGH